MVAHFSVFRRVSSLASPFFVLSLAAGAAAQTTMRVSVASDGVQANYVSSAFLSSRLLSSDGRFVVFQSVASNLAPAGAPPVWHLYVHDRQSGTTELVSLSSAGVPGDDSSLSPSLSADGRHVAFHTYATNFADDDDNGVYDVFLRDLDSATTVLVSTSVTGHVGYGISWYAHVSADGHFVAFDSEADDLVPADTNGVRDVYVRDMELGVTSLLSASSNGTPGNGVSYNSAISNDGRYVVFSSDASNLVAGDTNHQHDLFLRDRQTGATTRVSIAFDGGEADGASQYGSISDDGRWVAFHSSATNLVPGGDNTFYDVFLCDLSTETTTLLSQALGGGLGAGDSYFPVLSADGRRVVFQSRATNLAADDTDALRDVYLHDVVTGSNQLLSKATAGPKADADSESASLSPDGNSVAFDDDAANLVAGDVNSTRDIFVVDMSFTCPVVGYGSPKVASAGCRTAISTSGAPLVSGHDAFFVTATAALSQQSGLLLWSRERAALPFGGGTLFVQPPCVRAGPLSSGGVSSRPCSGTFSFHFGQAYLASHAVAPGETLYAQFWYRDPGYAPPEDIALSDAVRFTVGP